MLLEYVSDSLFLQRVDYKPLSLSDALEKIEFNKIELSKFFGEKWCGEIERRVLERIGEISKAPPFPLVLNADFTLARFCYALCRALRPERVVETGVAYGVTSAFILQALELNGRGTLYSIDLPPLARCADIFVGIVVPENLRHRWRMHTGASRQLLPEILEELGGIDMFLHDSLHTRRNMRFELGRAIHHTSCAIVADDIHGNPAFAEIVRKFNPGCHAAIREEGKTDIFGVILLNDCCKK